MYICYSKSAEFVCVKLNIVLNILSNPQKICIFRISSARSTKWCENLSSKNLSFLRFEINCLFLFCFYLKFFELRFSHHFVDLAELILNIYIFWGFDKIFNTIFYFTHTNSADLL